MKCKEILFVIDIEYVIELGFVIVVFWFVDGFEGILIVERDFIGFNMDGCFILMMEIIDFLGFCFFLIFIG